MSSTSIVLEDLAAGDFRLTRHAIERMDQRGVSKADICNVGETGEANSTGDGKVKVIGLDLDGEELAVVCVYDAGTLVITIF